MNRVVSSFGQVMGSKSEYEEQSVGVTGQGYLPVHMRRHGGGVPVDGPLLAGRGPRRGVGLQQHLARGREVSS